MNVRWRLNNMAKKDFDEYYFSHYKDYLEAIDQLAEWGEMVKDHMVSEEQMQAAKSTLDPIIEAQKFLDYIKFILDKPVKNKKQKQFNRQNSKYLDSAFTIENLKASESKAIENFKNKTEDILSR